MKKSLFKMSAVAVVMTLGAAISAPVLAQTSAPVVCPGYEKGNTTLVGERTGKKVQKAFEAYNEDLMDEALNILYEIDPSDDFDKAYVNRFIGNLLAAQEGQANKSMGYLVSAVEPKVLNDLEHAQTLKLLGDLSMSVEKYADAIKWYKSWMEFTCKEDAETYTRVANAYFQLKQFDQVIEPADKAIALYEKPNKNPYVLKLSAFHERKMSVQATEVAEELVRVFPEEKKWWTQLGLFYMLTEDYKKALSTFEMSYQQGFLDKENQIKTLSQLYASNDMPFKAAEVLKANIESGLVERSADNLASLANAYHQALEYKSAAKFYKEAADMTSDPEYYRKQGVLLLVAEDYKGAITALEAALERGVEEPAKVHFSLMEANFYAGRFKAAYEYGELAKKDRAMRRNANAWLPYIKQKADNRGIKI